MGDRPDEVISPTKRFCIAFVVLSIGCFVVILLFVCSKYCPIYLIDDVNSSQVSLGFNFTADKQRCPFGVLFSNPVEAMIGGNIINEYCTYDDICSFPSMAQCDNSDWKVAQTQYLPGNLFVLNDLKIVEPTGVEIILKESDSIRNSSKMDVSSRQKRSIPGRLQTLGKVAPRSLADENQELFYYMTNLNALKVSPDLHISQMLEYIIEVILRRCDPFHLEPMFTKTIHKAFLWLLSQYGTGTIADMSGEVAVRLKRALQKCSNNPHIIKVHGDKCLQKVSTVSLYIPSIGVESVKQYNYDHKHGFQWSKYDPIVDSIWLSIDTVHSLCSKYLANDGLIHEFTTNMVKLFRLEQMAARWVSQIPLLRPEIYDHVFLAPMNKSLRVLDACNLGATIISPFGRSKRPLPKANKLYKQERQKRSIDAVKTEDFQKTTYFCLQTEQEKKARFNELKELAKC